MFDGFFGGFYRFGEVIFLLLYVNVLWVLFTLLGGIVLGFGPSTVAMFSVFRKWSMGESDIPVFTTFWKTYREEFLRANALGWVLAIIGLMLYVNLNYIELENTWFSAIIRYSILIAALIYSIMLIFIFPLYVHYESTFITYFKNSIFVAIYNPIRTIYAIAAIFTLYYVFVMLPSFIFFIGPSLVSMVIMWIAYRSFMRIEYKQEQIQESMESEGKTTGGDEHVTSTN